MKKCGVFAFNVFGDTHAFTKTAAAYGMSEAAIKKLLTGFKIKYMQRSRYVRKDKTQWDTIDIIATKK